MNIRLLSRGSLVAAVAFLGLPLSSAYAQVQIAEDLLIDLDANTYNTGGAWTNTGTLTGNFAPQGNPTRINGVQGTAGVYFDDSEWFDGPITNPTLDGFQSTYSIEVWAYQGYIRPEETLVSWGNRGANNNNVSFNYGTDDRWGAMGHWGGADVGWGPNDPNGASNGGRAPGTPVEGQWHHLVYTYDGAGTQRVYKDGVFVNSESGLTLDPFDAKPIRIGAQTGTDGVTADGGNRYGGVIGKIRVHGGVLNDTQVQQNYTLDAATYRPVAPVTQFLTLAPAHRYTFNNLASGASGTVVLDVAGTAHAVILGDGAAPSGSAGLDLPGGSSGSAAYVDLPNGIASGNFEGTPYSSVTYETWMTLQSNTNWSRGFDFGTTNIGEVTGVGGDFSGTDYIMLTTNEGTNPNMRFAREGNGFPRVAGRNTQGNNQLGLPVHLVATYDGANQEWKWFQNGVLMEGFSSPDGPSTIPDVNNWLGRSNWSGDANTDAIYDEFRVYGYALNEDQVRGNFVAGPDVVNVPEPGAVSLLGIAAAGVLGRRRRGKQA
jgi:hypothetical protein